MSYTVAQNTSFLTVASVLQKVISFAYFTIIARLIGVENTGAYFFAISFTTIFAVVSDFGFGLVLTRESSRNTNDVQKYLNTVFWTKVLFGIPAYLLVVFFINILQYSPEIKFLVYLSGITMFFDNLHSVFYNVFRAKKNLVYESIGIVCSQGITLIIGTLALLNHLPIYWLILAYTIPAFLNFLYSSYFLRRVYGFVYKMEFDVVIFKKFLIFALPFAISGILARLYSYSDTILMSKMLGSEELGWWSVPYKIAFAFQFIPVALSASVYPEMSGLYIVGKEKISDLFQKSWRYLFIIVFPLSAGIIALADPIIIKLYKEQFAPAIPVLRILLISLIFSYLSYITGALLNATNRQKTQTVILGSALSINVLMNLFLIPRFGIMGAAYSVLVSNIFICASGFWFCDKAVGLNKPALLKSAGQAIWPAVIMGLIVFYLSDKIHFAFAIPVGGAVYFALLFLSGGLSIGSARRVFSRIRA